MNTEQSDDNEIRATVTLDDEKTRVDGSGASFSNGVLTVSEPGAYSLSGRLSDGQIVVNSSSNVGKVRLILNGVELYCSTDAPLLVESSPKETVLVLAGGTVNSISDNENRTLTDGQKESGDYSKAAVFSKDDLQLEGEGTLNINAGFNMGIFSKDSLEIRGGKINIESADDALRGRDSVEISAGTLTLKCKGDGIRTSNTDEGKGDLLISGGSVTVESDKDCIQSTGKLTVSGGTLSLTAAGGCTQNTDGNRQRNPFSESSEDEESEPDSMKSDKAMSIFGGELSLNSPGDALHSNAALEITGGKLMIATNDDGIHADTDVTIGSGEINIKCSYEGIEGRTVTVSGGSIDLVASDDGINATAGSSEENALQMPGGANGEMPQMPDGAGGEVPQKPDGTNGEMPQMPDGAGGEVPQKPDGANGEMPQKPDGANGEVPQRRDGGMEKGQKGFGNMGDPMGEYDSSCKITFTGGTVLIDAGGDGLDSNGDIFMTGGEVTVMGPTNNGNGALDYAGDFTLDGGVLLAAGTSGMAMTPSKGSESFIHASCSVKSGSELELCTGDGKSVYKAVSKKDFSDLVFASPVLDGIDSVELFCNSVSQGSFDVDESSSGSTEP